MRVFTSSILMSFRLGEHLAKQSTRTRREDRAGGHDKAKTIILQPNHISLLSHPREFAAVIGNALSTIVMGEEK
jgi:hypothetical protein